MPGGHRAGPGVLLQRNFAPFFIGSLVSYAGTWFQNIAQALLIYRLTESVFLVGVVNFSQFAAILLLSGWSGVIADRRDRRKVIVVTHLGAAVLTACLAWLTWNELATPPVVILFAFGVGASTAMSFPAMQALVPSLVSDSDVPAAVALNTITFNLSRALGPVLGVLVISRWSIGAAFLMNGISYLIMICGALLVKPRFARETPITRPRLRDSLAMLRRGRRLWVMLTLVALISLTVDPINTLTPAFSTQIYGREDTFTGFLIGSFGAGAVLGGLVLATVWRPSDARIVASLCAFAAMMTGFAFSQSETQGMLFLLLAGVAFILSQSSATIILQTSVEDGHRGRVMALWSVSYLGIRPLGSLVDGGVAAVFGLRPAAFLMTLPTLAGAVLVYRMIIGERRAPSE